MAAKKKPWQAAELTRNKRKPKAPVKRAALDPKGAVSYQSLRLTAKQAETGVRRAGKGYVEAGTELEVARIEQRAAERQLAAYAASKAAATPVGSP